jgi:hypothetical protein
MVRAVWQRTGFAGKTLWDWLQLLIVPLVLALAAFALNAAQADRDRQQDARQAAQERVVAEDRAREDALRGYLQQISDLITDHGLASRGAGQDVRVLASTLTTTTLRRLDRERKGALLRFLVAGDLINSTTTWIDTRDGAFGNVIRGPRISLAGADLRGVVVPRFLRRSSGPNGRGRYETVAATFSGADLRDADFRETNLEGVSLQSADLRGADFTDAGLSRTVLSFSCLSGARFARARIGEESDFRYAKGRGIDFSGARLNRVDFGQAAFADAELEGAKTRGVRLPPRDGAQRADCGGLIP